MIAIRGIGSNIARCLHDIIFDDVVEIKREQNPPIVPRYLICQGILYGKRRVDQTCDEIENTYRVNYTDIYDMCEYILENNNRARICVVGSESGISGSYDEIYGDSKRLIHHYIETKQLTPNQQLICIAPSIIADAGMTIRRNDRDNLSKLLDKHPKKRFITSMEVAKTIRYFLYEDLGYTTNVVIRMNGGRHTYEYG